MCRSYSLASILKGSLAAGVWQELYSDAHIRAVVGSIIRVPFTVELDTVK